MVLYDIDYKKLALLLLPVRLRRPRLAAFIYVMVSQVQHAARLFRSFRASTDYRLAHNGQICHLRAVLNDKYDPLQRRILIEDISSMPESLLHMRSTGLFLIAPARPGALTLGRRGFGGFSSYDFIVVLPSALRGQADETQLRAVVDTYRLAGKRYTLTYR